MHLLHRSSVFGRNGADGDKKKALLRRVGSSPRAPQPLGLMSRSESIKKRSVVLVGGTNNKKGGSVKQGSSNSKRARLRAGLAAALQELRLAGRPKRGPAASTEVVTGPPPRLATHFGEQCQSRASPAAAERAAAAGTTGPPPNPKDPVASSRGGVAVLLVLLVLALACVVALGRAPAVCCCCTCATWWCRGSSVDERRRRRVGVVLCSDEVRFRPQSSS